MHLPLAIGSFLFRTALVGLVSSWRTRGIDHADSQTYFLAGRQLPWIQLAGALLLTISPPNN
jgi:solute:Na+ symporter, SSS family